MERFRYQGDIEMALLKPLRFYYASSIADMINSRDIVIKEACDDFKQYEKQLKGYGKFALSIEKKLGYRPETSIKAIIIIPFIRHFPVEDNPENRQGLTIQDQTAKLDVLFPVGETKLFAQLCAKEKGINFDSSLLKQRSWLGQIALYNYYNWHGKDASFLVHVTNHPAAQKDQEDLKDLIPSFARLGIRSL